MLVNGARDQILADAAFAADQNSGVGGRHALDEAEHSLHFVALRDDVLVFVAAAERLAQIAIFLAQLVRGEFLADYENELGERKWLQHVVARARLHCVDGGFHRAVGGHHHHGNFRIHSFHRVQEIEAAHPGQLEIGDDEIEGVLVEELQARFGVRRRARLESLFSELQLEQAAHLGFVLDDEYGWFFAFHIGRRSDAICAVMNVRALPEGKSGNARRAANRSPV